MSTYVDLGALARIIVTCMLLGGGVAVAFAMAVIGADRQASAASTGARLVNVVLMVVGTGICLGAAGLGFWAMTQK